MEVAVNHINKITENNAMETLFSYLDRGIDDMEEGRVHSVDEAFRLINDRMKDEL